MELAKIILKLYIPLIVDSEKTYYDMVKEKIDYPTYIERLLSIHLSFFY